MAVGTPSNDDGSVDMRYVKSACKMIAENCNPGKVVVMKSTVPVGTYKMVQSWLGGVHTVISNPEFLREGTAVYDFKHGDRIVVGTPDGKPNAVIRDVYDAFSDDYIVWMDNASAEMTKYASNCLLATRLALWNEIAALSDATGANIHKVREGCVKDARIGERFLLAGPGYGGSCFPKDTRGLLQMFDEADMDLRYGDLIGSVIASNDMHKEYAFNVIHDALCADQHNYMDDKRITILGLAFKGGTDDVRESPAHTLLDMIDRHTDVKYVVVADPVATELPELKNGLDVELTTDTSKALMDADIVFVMTEWPQYKKLDLDYVKSLMGGNIIVDARNMWDRKECERRGFIYYGIGS
ncbi:MAG: UDP-glucose dehydrogenase family protein [Candidatus Thorarchaeota archaeon]